MLVEYGYILEDKVVGMYQCEMEDFKNLLKALPRWVDVIYLRYTEYSKEYRYLYINGFGWNDCNDLKYIRPIHFTNIFKE